MISQLQLALFVIIVLFFVAFGIACLLVIIGRLPNADPRFKQWAMPGFVVSLVSAVFSMFRAAFLTVGVPVVVTLNVPTNTPALKSSGQYEYDETQQGKIAKRTGPVQVGIVPPGGWQARVAGVATDSPLTLHFEDETGGWWQVGPFYSNVITQDLKKGPKVAAAAPTSLPGEAVVAAAEPQQQQAIAPQATQLKFNNYAKQTANRYARAYYDWRVFIDEPANVLSNIAKIDYVLHPTFPQPFQSSTDRDHQFQLTGSGWGGFNILITIHYTDGTETKTTYFLDLQKGWPDSTMQLVLEKIAVKWDGDVGPTSWTFDILVNGQSIARLPTAPYDDGGALRRGKEYLATANKWPSATAKVSPGTPIRLEVKGTRRSGEAAAGAATLPPNGGPIVVNVINPKDQKKGSFVFYLTAKT